MFAESPSARTCCSFFVLFCFFWRKTWLGMVKYPCTHPSAIQPFISPYCISIAVQHTHIITDCLALRVSVSDLMFSVLFVIQMHMHGLTYKKNGISWYFFYFIQNLWFFTIRRCFRNITSVNFRGQCYADFRATY